MITVHEILTRLETLGDAKLRAQNTRHGVGENQFGVKMGELRNIAKEIKTNHTLAKELWATGNFEAMQISLLVCKPKEFTLEELDQMVRQITAPQVADWFNSYVVKVHPLKEQLRELWMQDDHPWAARSGWSLTTERVIKNPEGLELAALLDRIEKELVSAPEPTKWTMNFCLGEIGINHPEFRERVLTLGERIGAYRDYPASKGCIPPFVPVWVNEMVRRQA